MRELPSRCIILSVLPTETYHFVSLSQIDCLICLPDKSGNFLAFRAKIARNTVKSEKTGFGMAITARPRPVFCVSGTKIPRIILLKLTEQRHRKKGAAGGFEPQKHAKMSTPSLPAPEKAVLYCAHQNKGGTQNERCDHRRHHRFPV